MGLLVNPVAILQKCVAMKMGVVQVCFIAFCTHMPPHPSTASSCCQTAASKAAFGRVPQHQTGLVIQAGILVK